MTINKNGAPGRGTAASAPSETKQPKYSTVNANGYICRQALLNCAIWMHGGLVVGGQVKVTGEGGYIGRLIGKRADGMMRIRRSAGKVAWVDSAMVVSAAPVFEDEQETEPEPPVERPRRLATIPHQCIGGINNAREVVRFTYDRNQIALLCAVCETVFCTGFIEDDKEYEMSLLLHYARLYRHYPHPAVLMRMPQPHETAPSFKRQYAQRAKFDPSGQLPLFVAAA